MAFGDGKFKNWLQSIGGGSNRGFMGLFGTGRGKLAQTFNPEGVRNRGFGFDDDGGHHQTEFRSPDLDINDTTVLPANYDELSRTMMDHIGAGGAVNVDSKFTRGSRENRADGDITEYNRDLQHYLHNTVDWDELSPERREYLESLGFLPGKYGTYIGRSQYDNLEDGGVKTKGSSVYNKTFDDTILMPTVKVTPKRRGLLKYLKAKRKGYTDLKFKDWKKGQ